MVRTVLCSMRAGTLERAFARALKHARGRRALTQEGLALSAGLDRTAISLLERGLRSPSLETVFALADALEIPASQLVAETAESLQRGRKARSQ